MPATRPFIPRITLAFDFDRTLATDSIDAVLALYDLRRDDWESRYEEPLGDDWDEIIRRGQALIDMGRERGRPLTRAILREAAAKLRLYDGAMAMPERLRSIARQVHGDIEVEFVVLSSGYAEIIEASGIMDAFDRLFASTFHFADSGGGEETGEAVCIKRIIGHPQKALYLEAIGKDAQIDGSNAPEKAGHPVDEHDYHVPFDQMIYLGDGASDLQAFGFLNGAGGLAIAISPDEEFASEDQQSQAQRVDTLAAPDYSEGSELLAALEHAVRACAERIALRAFGKGE